MSQTPADGSVPVRAGGFFVAPFAPDGDLLDVGFWEYRKLSQRWLDVCGDFLPLLTGGLRRSWGAELSHIETKLTTASGAATVSFYVRSHLTTSCLLLSGAVPSADAEVRALFRESVERMAATLQPGLVAGCFKQLSGLEQRPLAAFVVWAPEPVSDDDMGLVQELSLHLSGAFFQASGLSGLPGDSPPSGVP